MEGRDIAATDIEFFLKIIFAIIYESFNALIIYFFIFDKREGGFQKENISTR